MRLYISVSLYFYVHACGINYCNTYVYKASIYVTCRLLRAIDLKKKLDETYQTLPPAASLPPTHHIPPHTAVAPPSSLPPTLTKTTPTRATINDESNNDSTVSVDGQEPVLDLGIRPKTFD